MSASDAVDLTPAGSPLDSSNSACENAAENAMLFDSRAARSLVADMTAGSVPADYAQDVAAERQNDASMASTSKGARKTRATTSSASSVSAKALAAKVNFKCQECDYVSLLKANFERHMRHHLITMPFQCQLCSFSSPSNSAVQRHMGTHHHSLSSSELQLSDEPRIDRSSSSTVTASDSHNAAASSNHALLPHAGTPGARLRKAITKPVAARSSTGICSDTPGNTIQIACGACGHETNSIRDMKAHMAEAHHRTSLSGFTSRGSQSAVDSDSVHHTQRPGQQARGIMAAKRKHPSIRRGRAAAASSATGRAEITESSCKQSRLAGSRGSAVSAAGSGQAEVGAAFDKPSPRVVDCKAYTQVKADEPSLQCCHCTYLARCPSDLRRHDLVHTLDKRFCCSLCGKSYKYIGNLNVHLRHSHSKRRAAKLHSHHHIAAAAGDNSNQHTPSMSSCGSTQPLSVIQQLPEATSPNRPQRSSISLSASDVVSARSSRFNLPQARGFKRWCSVSAKKGAARRAQVAPRRPRPAVAPAPAVAEGGSKPLTSIHGIRPYKCVACGRRYNRVCDVQKHFHLAHSSMPDLSIVQLTREELLQLGESETDLATHYPNSKGAASYADGNPKNPADWARRFACSLCGKRSRWKWNMTHHVRKLHPGATGARVVTVSAEESLRREERQLATPGSGAAAVTRADEKLGQSAESQRAAQASDLAVQGASADSYKVAGWTGRYRCSLCLMRSDFAWAVRRHLRMVHSHPASGSTQDLVNNSRKETHSYNCSMCSQKANLKSDLQKHIISVHNGTADVTVTLPQSKWTKASSYKCKYCTFASRWRSAIHRHIRCKHPNKGVKGIIVESNIQARRCKAVLSSSANPVPDQSGIPSTSSCPRVITEQNATATGDQRVQRTHDAVQARTKWHCARCTYDHSDRQNVLAHLQGLHHLHAYQCSICQFFSDVDEDIENHIRTKHSSQSGDIIAGRQWIHNMANSLASDKNESDLQSNDRDHRNNVHRCKVDGIHYYCIFHDMKTSWQSAVIRHLKECHNRDPVKTGQSFDNLYRRVEDISAVSRPAVGTRRRFCCSKCTFSTRKLALHEKHMQRHQPCPENDFKCDRCDYWVSSPQRLDQHIKRHHITAIVDDSTHTYEQPVVGADQATENSDHLSSAYLLRSASATSRIEISDQSEHSALPSPSHPARDRYPGGRQSPSASSEPSSSMANLVSKRQLPPSQGQQQHAACRIASSHGTQQSPEPRTEGIQKPLSKAAVAALAQRRFRCPVCPFRCTSGTKLLYHKQFHRPKATAKFKCPKCKYWVSRNRLLKQHIRVHDSTYSSVTSPKAVNDKEATPLCRTTDHASCRSSYDSEESMYQCDDAVDMAELKQRMMRSRILPVVLRLPVVPELISQLDHEETVSLSYGRKLYICNHCPYAVYLPSLLTKHETNHGLNRTAPRAAPDASHAGITVVPSSAAIEYECPLCDYWCDDDKSLGEHIFVHSTEYTGCVDEVITADHVEEMKELAARASEGAELVSSEGGFNLKYNRVSDEYVLEPSTEDINRYQCEKCPYAASRKEHFQRHMSMHNSRQRYMCTYCDYSLPVFSLLGRHEQLHLSPNPNLVMCQKPGVLSLLPFIPADQALMDTVLDDATDESTDFYENRPVNSVAPLEDVGSARKKLFRCEWCPFTTTRKDHLGSHLNFHNVRSDLKCPYCDYNVNKASLLKQHVRLHFMPFIGEDGTVKPLVLDSDDDDNDGDCVHLIQAVAVEPEFLDISEVQSKDHSNSLGGAPACNLSAVGSGHNAAKELICQYCERRFHLADDHHNHELQHLIGLVDSDDESCGDTTS